MKTKLACAVLYAVLLPCAALAQVAPPIPIDVPPVPVLLESDGSSNGLAPTTVCGFVYDPSGFNVPLTLTASWQSLATGQVRTSPVSTHLPRPDLSKVFPVTNSDLGWCTVAPFSYGEGSWQVTITAAPPSGTFSLLPAAYSFTVTAPVDAAGNPIASFVGPLPAFAADAPALLSGYVYDRTQAAGHVDGITGVSIVARNTATPAASAIVLAASVPLTHYTQPEFPAAAGWSQSVTLPAGTWDLTVTARASSGAVNRQMVRVEVH